MTKPKICEILNVEVGQRFTFGNIKNDICFNKNGDAIFPDYLDAPVPASAVLSMINNPDYIVKKAIFTEQDIADAKAIARVFQNRECIKIYRGNISSEPNGLFIRWEKGPYFDFDLNPDMFPSLISGESIMISNGGNKIDLCEEEE